MRVRVLLAATALVLAACGGDDSGDDQGGGDGDLTHPAGVKADSVNPGGGPYGVAVVPGTIYFTRLYQETLGRWTLGDGDVEVTTVGAAPTDVDVAVQRIFVADQLDSRLSVIGQNSGSPSEPILLTGDPFRVRTSPDGSRVLVTTNDGVVSLVDPIAEDVIVSVDHGEDLNGVAWLPNGTRVFVSSMLGGVTELNGTSLAETRSLAATGRLQEVAVTPDGAELWVANEEGALRVYRVSDLTLLGTVPGADGVFGMAISPDGEQVLATVPGNASVLVIDRAARSIQETLPVAPTPRRVRYNANGARAYVTTESGWVYEIR